MGEAGRHVFWTLLVDVALVIVATVGAVVVRDNLTFSPAKLAELLPYLAATIVAAAVVFGATKTSAGIWRFSSRSDYGRIVMSVALVVLIACIATFSYDRLDHVSRSLPLLQGIFAASLMIAGRAFFRAWRSHRQGRRKRPKLLLAGETPRRVGVLVVGVSRLAETYLRAAEDFASDGIQIVGVLGQRERQIGRHLTGYPILGRAEAVRDILGDLETHGMTVDRLVITCRPKDLSEAARRAVFGLEAERNMEVHVLAEQFGLTPPKRAAQVTAPQTSRFAIEPERLALNSHRMYWPLKRAVDIIGAAVLLVVLAPVVAVAAVALAVSLGFPILFWQQRPGLGGRPFRLYKLRTMRPAHDSMGRHLSDEERTSRVGDFVRRTRIDEVPQLINILLGDMSFIGPRPLLPRDQSPTDRARLLVRPGLTGWAQVAGGRTISADDKAALDVWYVQNASFLLDLRICLRTIPMVVFGERVSRADILQAWHDLQVSGIARERPPASLEDAA